MREKKQHPFAWWIFSKEEEKDKRNREETKNPKLIKCGHVYKRKQLSKSRALLNYNLLSTPKPPQNILRFTVIALILFLHLFLGEREREKTPHNPHARQLHLPTSSSRAIISHYNIALGQLEVEDYPVCWCTGSAMIIGLASQPQQQQQEKIKERLEIPESNSSMMRFLLLYTDTDKFFLTRIIKHHQIFFLSVFLIWLAPANISNAAWWSLGLAP